MKNNFTAKNKIIVVGLLWVVLSALNFMYLFNILDSANKTTIEQISKKKKDLAQVQAQLKSQSLSQRDLNDLATKPLQPDSLFSRDITFVNELKIFENLTEKYNIKTQFSGVSGTVGGAAAAQSVTPLVVIPYSMGVTGDLRDVVNFMESLEHLSFINRISGISLSASEGGGVSASLRANFYLRK